MKKIYHLHNVSFLSIFLFCLEKIKFDLLTCSSAGNILSLCMGQQASALAVPRKIERRVLSLECPCSPSCADEHQAVVLI